MKIVTDLFVLLRVVEENLTLIEYGVIDFQHRDVVCTVSKVNQVK